MSSGSSEPPVSTAPAGVRDHGAPGIPDRRRRLALLAAPVFASILLVLVCASRMDAPFSPSFDGFNTAVWATGSQAVRTDGWWATRLGATAGPTGEDVPYAHHPPLVRVEITAAELALGEHRWVDRLPALLSSLAAIWCCWGWLGACGFSPGPRALGVLAVGGSGAMLTYGAMANMEVVWLPTAFALLWAWQHAERAGGGWWSCFLLGVLGCTAAHQGILLVGALAVLGLVQARSARRRLRPHESAALAASVAGALTFVVWAWWAAGGLGDLMDIARTRSGAEHGWGEFVRAQAEHSLVLFGIVALVCLLAGPFLTRERPALTGQLVVIWAVGLSYAVVFRQGATIHPYWNAALVRAVALGAGLLGTRLARADRRALPVAVVLAVAMAVPAGIVAERNAHLGDGAGLVARVVGERGDGTLHSTEIVSEWVTYESDGPVEPVYTCAALVELARRDAAAPVLTSRTWIESSEAPHGWTAVTAREDSVVRGDFVLTSAGVLHDAACPPD